MSRFEQVIVSLCGTWDPSLPIAASRAGALGILDLTYLQDAQRARISVQRLLAGASGRSGLLLEGIVNEVTDSALSTSSSFDTIVLLPASEPQLKHSIERAHAVARHIGVVATCHTDAEQAFDLGCDFVFAKGHEAGGSVGEETCFVLLQRLISWGKLPVYAWGGIGQHTIAAAQVSGARGVVLDWQLALLTESPLPRAIKRRLANLDGSETAAVAYQPGRWFRFYNQPRANFRVQIEPVADHCRHAGIEGVEEFNAFISSLLGKSASELFLPLGQDAAFSPLLTKHAPNVSRALAFLDDQCRKTVTAAARSKALSPHSPLAQSHHSEYPVVQGPMTHVSDVPEFCYEVAKNGALPFLALALMRGPALRQMLEKTKHLLGDLPWGVGILGFVPQELRAEQVPLIEEIAPTHAIIAGGRPDQAASLERRGIKTYLHVPSPGMLETFLREGARRFVFEGRECGGHVGPRTSFVLWESMIHVLVNVRLSPQEAEKIHILFAGGIHDATSAAMVAALAQPLVELGMKIGVLLGTAYLATQEIVDTGAVKSAFQQITLDSDHTVLLETGPGHAIRCADTEFVRAFEQQKQQLKQSGRTHEEIRDELENLNLGRLRMASKGVARIANPVPGQSLYCSIDEERQRHQGMYMLGQIAALRRGSCTLRELHESVTTAAVDQLRIRESRVDVLVEPPEHIPPTLDIAIIGMSCLLPGATDAHTYWDNILAKRDLIEEVPADRFEVDRWFDTDPAARDKIYSRWGGFVPHILFDPLRYGIPPAALKSIEPMQLLALELVARALNNAGYEDHNPLRSRTSVILGVGGGAAELGVGYGFRSTLPKFFEHPEESILAELPEWTEDSFAGILLNVVAGRVANRFDLGGANFTVDAACASSLAAVYLACRELAAGAADMVITGGCDTMQGPMGYLCFSKTGALSPSGRSRPFDANADGIAISEGHAAVVLKRRADAERDGDRIYAVIRGAAGGSDGRHKGLTAPRYEGQLQTLRRAYQQARFNPASIGLFEAHGTGTAVGDQAECLALKALLEEQAAPARSVAIGSVKSMIGHTKCAAGVSGLIKATLALHHKVLPPTLHVKKPNAKAGLDHGPLYVNSDLRPWLRGESPRRAGVSAFGFGGSNFHVVLEEYGAEVVTNDSRMPHRALPAELFLFSASSVERLFQSMRALDKELRSALNAGAALSLADLAYTCHVRHSAGDGCHRAAIVATSIDDLLLKLRELIALVSEENKLKVPAGIFFTRDPLGADSPLAFLFPGQGSQFPAMLRELAVEFREVSACFELADAVLASSRDTSLSATIFPPPRFSDEDRAQDAEVLKQTQNAQPALGASNAAIAALLASFRVQPQMTGGHSYGELVALYSAGAIDEQTLYRLSAARGQAMKAETDNALDRGTMLAVNTSGDVISSLIDDCDGVWLANLNSPRQTILTGTAGGIERITELLSERGFSCQRIPVSCAFHSPLMSQARAIFSTALEAAPIAEPRLTAFSNLKAEEYPNDPAAIRDLLLQQIDHQVRFQEQIEAMYRAGARIFVEVGPGRVLTGLVRDILAEKPHSAIATQPRAECGITNFLYALGELHSQGVRLDPERLYEGRTLTQLDLRELAKAAQAGPARHQWWIHGSAVRPALEAPRPHPIRITNPSPPQLSEPPIILANTTPSGFEDISFEPEIFNEKQQQFDSAAFDLLPPSPQTEQEADSLRWTHNNSEVNARAEAHAHFQETMRQFLEVQRTVMLSFLGQPDSLSSQSVPSSLVPPSNGEDFTHHSPQAPKSNADVATVSNGASTTQVASAPLHTDSQSRQITNGHHHPTSPATSRVESSGAGATPAVEATEVVALDEQLLKIVSQRTGYPSEMLDLEANLEADLGIDSIKRVEIISAFRRETLPEMKEPPATFMEQMTAAKTMRAILGVISQYLQNSAFVHKNIIGGSTNGRHESAGTQSDSQVASCPRCVPAVVETPLTSAGTTKIQGIWIVTNDGLGVAQALTRTIAALGGQCTILAAEDLCSSESASATVENLRTSGLPICGLVHLAPLAEAPQFPDLDAETWKAAVHGEVKSLLYLLQALAPELTAETGESCRVICMTRGAGDFARSSGSECLHPWRGGIAGLLKVAACEWTKAVFRTVDVIELPDASLILDEADSNGPVEVGYRNGQRLSIQLTRSELPASLPSQPPIGLGPDSVVLVLAGGKGITAAVACEFAHRTQAKLILAGRSAAPGTEEASTVGCTDPVELRRRILEQAKNELGRNPDRRDVEERYQRLQSDRELKATLNAIKQSGSFVDYVQGDVQDPLALTTLVDNLRQRFGRIDGVIHGAGIIEDKYIIEKSAASFDRVVDTKVEPLLTLSRILRADELKLLVVFSSVSGFFGNPGQADYATANEMLNRLARRLRDVWKTHVIAFGWGPWTGAGMVKAEVARQFEERGVGMITVVSGQEAAWREIAHASGGDVRVILGPGKLVAEADALAATNRSVSVDTPLLRTQRVRHQAEGLIEAEIELDGERTPYLRDHRIDGKSVLPLAFVVEFMAELAAASEPSLEVSEINDLRQLKGIVLSDRTHRLLLRGERLSRTFEHAVWRVQLFDPAMPGRLNYEASIVLVKTLPAPPEAPDFDALSGPFPIDVEEGYRRWLFHGPLFHAIDFYRGFDETGVDCILCPSTPSACLNQDCQHTWLIDPVMIDIGPQLAALWSRAQTDTMLLPSRLAHYRRYGALNGDPLECYFRVISSDESTLTANVWFVRDGLVLGYFSNLECAGSRELNRITGGVLV